MRSFHTTHHTPAYPTNSRRTGVAANPCPENLRYGRKQTARSLLPPCQHLSNREYRPIFVINLITSVSRESVGGNAYRTLSGCYKGYREHYYIF